MNVKRFCRKSGLVRSDSSLAEDWYVDRRREKHRRRWQGQTESTRHRGDQVFSADDASSAISEISVRHEDSQLPALDDTTRLTESDLESPCLILEPKLHPRAPLGVRRTIRWCIARIVRPDADLSERAPLPHHVEKLAWTRT